MFIFFIKINITFNEKLFAVKDTEPPSPENAENATAEEEGGEETAAQAEQEVTKGEE